MILSFTIAGAACAADLGSPLHISIPLDFRGAQPCAYGAPPARAEVLRAGAMVGDTREGGSCNVESYTFMPHCNGTHTECIGHIVDERLSVHTLLHDTLLPATLVSVAPVSPREHDETTGLDIQPGDTHITAAMLRAALEQAEPGFLDALVIRTLPNGADKVTRDWSVVPAPFFTHEAMEFIAASGVSHLLVDIPSLDRADDGGRLAAHRIFWNMPAARHTLQPGAAAARTVTEFIHVPDEIADGAYLLNLQCAPFATDAAPSRPVLFTVHFLRD